MTCTTHLSVIHTYRIALSREINVVEAAVAHQRVGIRMSQHVAVACAVVGSNLVARDDGGSPRVACIINYERFIQGQLTHSVRMVVSVAESIQFDDKTGGLSDDEGWLIQCRRAWLSIIIIIVNDDMIDGCQLLVIAHALACQSLMTVATFSRIMYKETGLKSEVGPRD